MALASRARARGRTRSCAAWRVLSAAAQAAPAAAAAAARPGRLRPDRGTEAAFAGAGRAAHGRRRRAVRASAPMRAPVPRRSPCSPSRSRFDGSLAHLLSAAAARCAAGRAGDAQGLPRRSLPGARGARGRRGRRAASSCACCRAPRPTRSSMRARAAQLFVLLEAFDEDDIALMHELVGDVAPAACSSWSGVNCRDLRRCRSCPGASRSWRRCCRAQCRASPRAAWRAPPTRARVAAAGYQLALVGSALMQDDDPQALAADMLAAGRAAPAVPLDVDQDLWHDECDGGGGGARAAASMRSGSCLRLGAPA